MQELVQVQIQMPRHLKDAAEREARRRGISVSALIKNFLSGFLPKTIGGAMTKHDDKKEEK